MNEKDTPQTGAVASDPASDVVRLDEGHHVGTGGLPDRFPNPGLPPHVERLSDTSPAAAKRAERVVVGLFLLSIVATVLFVVAYFAIDEHQTVFIPGIGTMGASHAALGVTMALSLLGIGFGAVQWAKTLMPDHESVEMRHPMRSADAARSGLVETMQHGAEASQITRRPMLKYTLGGALGLFAIPTVLPVIAGLGTLPGDDLSYTFWDGPKGADGKRAFKPLRLMRDPEGTPIRADQVTNGSVFHVMPEGLLLNPDEPDAEHLEHGILEAKAKAAVLLIRLDPAVIKSQKQRDWGVDGIVAYSKICTHVGCPVGLYEQTTHHLLCPCHQSTFDVTDDCKVIFGPAKRALPQLPITIDDEGYLVSKAPFHEAIGPSFWERG